MKKKSSPRIIRHTSKEDIMNKAIKGVYDHNPLLATPHHIACKTCGFTERITYLDYLKSGRFKLGKMRTIEVSYATPTISGLSNMREKITPILMTIRCERCGTKIRCSPVSVEYLLFVTSKPQKTKHMYT